MKQIGKIYFVVSSIVIIFHCTTSGMEESFIIPRELFIDGGTIKSNVDNVSFPQLGVYATPYDMSIPLIAIHSQALIDQLPEILRQQLVTIFGITGTPETIPTRLHEKFASKDLHVALVFWEGLASKPSDYNLVFHPVVARWRKSGTETFNIPIKAGLFLPRGIRAAPQESIPFNSLGSLGVNLHDRDNYSPNNGKFSVEQGRSLATFWAMGALERQVTISYNVLLIDPAIQKVFVALGEEADWEGKSIDERLRAILSACERLTKRFDGEDKQADAQTLYAVIELLRAVEKGSLNYRKPEMVRVPTPEQSPRKKI